MGTYTYIKRAIEGRNGGNQAEEESNRRERIRGESEEESGPTTRHCSTLAHT